MAGSNATRRVDQIHWNVTLGWIVERNICKMLGWQSILTKVVPRSGTISWEGILLRYECSKRPICIPGAYNDQRFLALACTVNSAHQSDQFRSRAQSHLKPPAMNSINLIGNVTTVFLSFLLLLPFPLRIYQARSEMRFYFCCQFANLFFYFLFVSETRNKIYSPLVNSSMGDKISFKIIGESCSDWFRLCLWFELYREFNRKVNDARQIIWKESR